MDYFANVSRVLDSATSEQVERGRAWYPTAHNLAAEISTECISTGAGIIAAYSIQNPWNRNVMLARQTMETHIPAPHTRMVRGKAWAILNTGDPVRFLGPKTSAFAATIVDPSVNMVVVDRHARDIAFGAPVFKNPGIGKGLYSAISDSYRAVALQSGLMPSEVQAITWVVWRDDKGLAWAD